jgi:4-hydroxy-tetrahydrodipicolinate synthase
VIQTPLPAGIYPYLVSPVGADGTVDVATLQRLVDDLIAAGVHGISPLGSTGEVMYLTFPQRLEIVRAAIAAAGGRVPVVPGVAAFSTADAVSQAQAFAAAGASGLVVMRLHAFPVDDEGVISYFSAVAAAVDCPIVLYTNPGLLGSDLNFMVLDQLRQVPNIRYIKDASGTTGRLLSIADRFGDDLVIFSASAHIPLLVFELGAAGWMAGPACVVPEAAVELRRRFLAGDRAGAAELQRELWPLNEAFTTYPLGACIKAALTERGYPVGDPIAPQRPLGPDARAQITKAIARADAAWPRQP